MKATKIPSKNKPSEYSQIKKEPNEILILHFNARSILNKIEDLIYIIKITNADIICLCETWLDTSTPENCILIPGYTTLRKDRTENFLQKYMKVHGGGVAIIHKNNLKIEVEESLNDEIEDILWVKVKANPPFLLGTIYRPDYSDMMKSKDGETKLEINIQQASEKNQNIIVMGDLNIDMASKNKNKTSLNHIFKSYNLKQLIRKPTRVDPNTLKTKTIDQIWITKDLKQLKSSGTTLGISDHAGLFLKMNTKIMKNPPRKIKIRNFKKYNKENFNSEVKNQIETSPYQNLLENGDVNNAAKTLVEAIAKSAERHAPFIEVTLKNEEKPAPWYTPELECLIQQKNELLSDTFLYGKKKFKSRIDMLQNKIKSKKRILRKKYIRKAIEEAGNDSKKLWKLLNSLTHRTSTIKITEPSNMDQTKANLFNSYFAEIGTKYQKQVNPDPECPNYEVPEFSFMHESIASITKIIENLKTDTAVGIDGIGVNLIKDLKTTIAPYLADLVNTAYEHNIFPQNLKTAIITPIFKEGDKENISNYRPISVLTAISKILERSAANQLAKHFTENLIINPCQHAYQISHSTTTCLAEILNTIYSLLDQKQYVALAKLDLSKAFDTINHQLLIKKLSKMGLNENSIKWITSYLQNRSHITKFQKYVSNEEYVKTGVPQGSILGPLLFLIFINDLPKAFKDICHIFGYADDTQLVISAPTLPELKQKIEQAITSAQTWYDQNNMKINPTKTEIVVFKSKKSPNPKLRIKVPQSKKQLKPKPHIKVLGMYIDESLTFKKHINILKRKTMNTTRNLHRINHLIPMQQRLILYNALVVPHFNYLDVLYNGCNAKSKTSLQLVQNFNARSMTLNKKYDSASKSLKELKLLNLVQRREIHESVFIHKIMLLKKPRNLYSQYQKYFMQTNTRAAKQKKMKIPTHRTSKFEKSPLYRTIKRWNSTPHNIPKDNIKHHKAALQNLLLKNQAKISQNPNSANL